MADQPYRRRLAINWVRTENLGPVTSFAYETGNGAVFCVLTFYPSTFIKPGSISSKVDGEMLSFLSWG